MFMHASLPAGVVKRQGGERLLVAFIVSTEKKQKTTMLKKKNRGAAKARRITRNHGRTAVPSKTLSTPEHSHEKHTRTSREKIRRTLTFFFIQSKADVGLLLHTVGEAVEGKQVAFPVVPLEVESPVEKKKQNTQEAVERLTNDKQDRNVNTVCDTVGEDERGGAVFVMMKPCAVIPGTQREREREKA